MSDLPKMDEGTKAIIRDISSAVVRAESAKNGGDYHEELKYLLYTIQEISVLILRNGDGRTTDDIAKSYATTSVSSSARIRDILFARR